MANIKSQLLGKRYQFTPHFFDRRQVWGKVTWVHPKGRYALIEAEYTNFLGTRVKLRECFKIVDGRLV